MVAAGESEDGQAAGGKIEGELKKNRRDIHRMGWTEAELLGYSPVTR